MLTPFRPRVKKRRGSSTLAPPSITLKTLGLGVRHLDEVIVYRPTLVITTELEDMSISSPLHILASADCLEPAAFFEFVQHSLSIRGRGCLISCPSDLGLPSLVSFLSSSPNESLTWDRSSTCSGRAYSQLFPVNLFEASAGLLLETDCPDAIFEVMDCLRNPLSTHPHQPCVFLSRSRPSRDRCPIPACSAFSGLATVSARLGTTQ